VKARPFPILGLDKSLALAVLHKSHTDNLFVWQAGRDRNFNQIPTNMFKRGNANLLPLEIKATGRCSTQGMSGLLFKPVADFDR
jgi:hypothetical protein